MSSSHRSLRHRAFTLAVTFAGLVSCASNPGQEALAPHRTAEAVPLPNELSHGKPHTDPQARAQQEEATQPDPSFLIDLSQLAPLDQLLPRLLEQRVIYVGENHTEMSHHLQQLEVIRQLHAQDPRLAIGMEMFQLQVQNALDRYIAGEISQKQLLLDTEWYRRWGYDFLLYKPILDFARDQGIPVVALNVPSEMLDLVREKGFAGLTETQRAQLSEQLDDSDEAYRKRLRSVFSHHSDSGRSADFRRFFEVQLTWDETMGKRVADFLKANPDHRMVVLAGSGHLAWRSGIPARVKRRTGEAGLVLLAAQPPLLPGMADFAFQITPVANPRSGLLNVALEDSENGPLITQVMADGAAARAGLETHDRILAINGERSPDINHVKVLLLEHQPGDAVELEIQRKGFWGGLSSKTIQVVLGD